MVARRISTTAWRSAAVRWAKGSLVSRPESTSARPMRACGAKEKTYHRKEDDLSWGELVRYIRNVAEFNPLLANRDVSVPRMILAVELNKRLVLALSCIGFVLIGSPLGIKAHRKESSIGVAISIFLLFNFFLFIIIAESLTKHPSLRPDLMIWMPVLLSFGLGIRFLRRMG